MLTAEQIIAKIRSDPKVPAPSHAIFEVLKLTRDPDCEIKRVSDLIARDGGLTAQLLREANSVLYGGATRTSSVAQACMRLGLKRVRAAVLNRHIVNGLGSSRPPGFDPNRYWQLALSTSVAARHLCQQTVPAQMEDASTAGLLCDIGVGLLAYGVPQDYVRVLKETPNPPAALERAERRLLGLSHAEAGASVLEDWKLDAPIIDAVRRHHDDVTRLAAKDVPMLARVVATAAMLSQIALDGSDMDALSTLFSYAELVSKEPDALVGKLLDKLVQEIQQTAESLEVDVGAMDAIEANLNELIGEIPDAAMRMSFRPMEKR